MKTDMSRQWKIGDSVPLEYQRDIISGPDIPPVWHALIVPPLPGRESAAVEMLKRKDVFAFFPTREVRHHNRGREIVRKFPIITRIIYAQFRNQPQFDVLKARRIITGVYSIGDRPISIPPDVIRAIQGLPTEIELLEQAQAELRRIRPGDKATLIGGPFDGMLVDVTESKHGRVWFNMLTGIKGDVDAKGIVRVLPDDTK